MRLLRKKAYDVSMADQAADNIAYFAKEVQARIEHFRSLPMKDRRVTILKERLKDLAYWSEYLIPLLNDLTPKRKTSCECPVNCKYCGAARRRDTVGHYCPTKNCQWEHGYKGCLLNQNESATTERKAQS